ncbi:DNA polymerase III subunit gamma and tau, partial [Streptomyces jumonjinensis]|nr:DNA polymerase III subunit gamma and tau [Streptomyces jumonjinensis]
VAGFDGTTLQLGFINAGARDNFSGSGSEDVLKQALAERFNVQWKIEAIIDPSGGVGGPSTPAPAPGGYGARAPQQQSAAPYQQAPAPAAPAPAARPAAAPAPSAEPRPAASAPAAPVHSPPPVSPEDDVPEDDDPDLVDSALSGHDLIVRELGATVVEEYTNE